VVWFQSSLSRDEIQPQKEQTMNNIYVGNLSFRTTQDELHTLFSHYGNVERVNLVTDRETGQPRGFAFVEMTDGAANAIDRLNGYELDGRALTVNEARPKPAGAGGGFGTNRRPGGGGGRSRGPRW
jgi:cold-inducible RNA-binding protein